MDDWDTFQEEKRNIPGHFILQKSGLSSDLMGHLAPMQTSATRKNVDMPTGEE